MSLIFGCLTKPNNTIAKQEFKNAMQKLRFCNPDISDSWYSDNVAFGSHLLCTTPESLSEKLPYYDSSSKCCITADARIDYREELAQKLGISNKELRRISDSKLILHSYLAWDVDCVKHLFGDFAFGIWDEKKGRLFCARDHLGCRPFCYYVDNQIFAFSSALIGLHGVKKINWKIREQYIVDCLTGVIPTKTQTPYENIFNLEPGHILMYVPNESVKIRRYWDLKDTKQINNVTEESARKELFKLIEQAVSERLRSISSVGAELSGGLDSSSVVTIASKICRKSNIEFNCFSHALTNAQAMEHYPFRDDRGNIEAILEKTELSNHFYITAEGEHGSFKALAESMEILSKPIIQHYSVLSDLLFQKAKQNNVRIMLSGFGGDEGVTYQGAGYYEELISSNQWNILKRELRTRIRLYGGNYFKLYLKAFLQRIWPKSIITLTNVGLVKDFRRGQYRYFALEKGIQNKYQAKKRYFKYKGFPSDNNLKQRQYKRITHNHIMERLEGSYLCGLRKEVEYRYPLLDVKLLEYFYSLPSHLKFKNGLGRYIFRQAMKGRLPENIRLRTDKLGTSIPHSQYRFMLDEQKFRDLIKESQTSNSFHYVDYVSLEKMADKLVARNSKKSKSIGPRVFLSYISILLAQKWQREGKIKIGIKY
jgi:asparagine synthase (glutamine-hydrolysing)